MQPPQYPPPQYPPPYQQPYPQGFQPPQPPKPQPPATPPPLPRDVSVMDALRFTTSGSSGWANVMYCALLYLSTQIIPILGLIVMQGFFAEVHRRLVLRHPEPYVRFDFSDLSNYLSRGVAPFVMTLVLALPFALVGVALAVGVVLLSSAAAATAFGGDEELAVLAGFGVAAVAFLPLALLWLALSNAAITRAELTGDLTKSFAFGAVWAYAARTWKRAIVCGILMAFVSIGLVIVGTLACFVGLFVTASIQMIASFHLRWQIYNEYLLEGGEPIELALWETLPSEAPKPPVQGAPPPGYGAPPPGYGGPPPG
jgi:hypothetical protein